MFPHTARSNSRVERSEDFSRAVLSVKFDDDSLAHAFEDDDPVVGDDIRSLKSDRGDSINGPPRSPASPLPFEAPWISLNLRDPEELALALPTDGSYSTPRHSRTSSELPPSSLRDATPPATSRSRTASAPDLLHYHANNGAPAAMPGGIADFHLNMLSRNAALGETHDDGVAQNIVTINGPDAEQTVPYASRVVRFFSGVKGAEE